MTKWADIWKRIRSSERDVDKRKLAARLPDMKFTQQEWDAFEQSPVWLQLRKNIAHTLNDAYARLWSSQGEELAHTKGVFMALEWLLQQNEELPSLISKDSMTPELEEALRALLDK